MELLVTLALIGLLAALLLPALARSKTRSYQIACIGNLRQIGIAFHGFAHEHGGQFPQNLAVASGGTLESSRASESFWGVVLTSGEPFFAVSNELGNPKVLKCPAVRRPGVPSGSRSATETPDYAAIAGAVWGDPGSALVVDRNVDRLRTRPTTNAVSGARLDLVWTPERHAGRGNVLWGDGHAASLRMASIPVSAVTGAGGGSSGSSGTGASGSGSPGGRAGKPDGGRGSGGGAGGFGGGPPDRGASGPSSHTAPLPGPGGRPAIGIVQPTVATAPGVSSRAAATPSWDGAGEEAGRERTQRTLQRGLLALILACMIVGLLTVLAHAWNRYRALSS